MSIRDDFAPADAVAMTRALVRIPSVNPDLESGGAGEAALAAAVAPWLERWGYTVQRIDHAPGRATLVARLRRGAGLRLMLNGHLDTVGVANMSVAPFGAELRQGRVYGRGACDMKAGVATILDAARAAAAAESWRGELILALVADEEHASIGTAAVVAAGVSADAAVVCEPTELAVMPAHKGFVWLEVEFRGRAAHGSRPDRGIDAIRHAGAFLARLDEIERGIAAGPRHPLLGHGSLHAGTIRGGAAASIYPDRCTLVLERRTLPAEPLDAPAGEVERLLASLRASIPQLDAGVRVLLAQPGSDVAAAEPVVASLLAAASRSGVAPQVRGMTAWVDAALLNAAGIPAVCFGPGSIELAHTADESVPVNEIASAASVLRDFVLDFLS